MFIQSQLLPDSLYLPIHPTYCSHFNKQKYHKIKTSEKINREEKKIGKKRKRKEFHWRKLIFPFLIGIN